MNQTSIHSNETSKNILFIDIKQFREQSVSGMFLFRSNNVKDSSFGNPRYLVSALSYVSIEMLNLSAI